MALPDGRTPKLAPVYDVLSTIPYIPKDDLPPKPAASEAGLENLSAAAFRM